MRTFTVTALNGSRVWLESGEGLQAVCIFVWNDVIAVACGIQIADIKLGLKIDFLQTDDITYKPVALSLEE